MQREHQQLIHLKDIENSAYMNLENHFVRAKASIDRVASTAYTGFDKLISLT